jgi:hypothetical protein
MSAHEAVKLRLEDRVGSGADLHGVERLCLLRAQVRHFLVRSNVGEAIFFNHLSRGNIYSLTAAMHSTVSHG